MRSDLELEILALKKKHNAQILAHLYQDGDIQDIADHVGDSLYLAQQGEKSSADVILLAGVVFMAESVKILSPNKTVIVPDLKAGCSLVDSSPAQKFKLWREQHPTAVCVTYVNSSAEVKALSDVICTSSNAEKIINAIPKDRQILFAPDKNLGGFLSRKLGRDMIMWPGSCEVHVLFQARLLYQLKQQHPDALVLAHPECEEDVLAFADVIGSTSKLLDEVKVNKKYRKFIVATEHGIFHQMQKARSDAELIQAPMDEACNCNNCPYMKLSTLEKVRNALRDLKPTVSVDASLIDKSRIPLRRMLDITDGKPVTWPTRFQT